jgi:peptidoglycan/LPS O-acetylase OafA/YrhL
MDDRKRDPWLDGLRGAAVLLVLGRHLELPNAAHPLLAAWQRGGWIGVDLFFVLSGFLVGGLLFREFRRSQSIALPRFLLRRALRILPPFYVLLGCTWLLAGTLHGPTTPRRAFFAEICFVQNYVGGIWNHTWSLAVEEHFYIGLPLVLFVIAWMGRGQRDPFRPLVAFGAALVLALPCLRCVHAWSVPYHARTHVYPTHLRIDALLAGVLLAYAYNIRRDRFEQLVARRRPILLLTGLACLAPPFLFELGTTWFLHTFGLSLLALGSACLIAAGLGGTTPRPMRWLAPLGGVSYSIYLWHMPVLIWGVSLLEQALGYRAQDSVRIGIYLIGALVAGSAMAWLIERPLLRLRDRWLPARSLVRDGGGPGGYKGRVLPFAGRAPAPSVPAGSK